MISLPTYQHGNDKEETNQHFIPGKAFLEKKANKDGQGCSNHIDKITEDYHMALNEEAVERTPSSAIHLVNQSFDVNFPIWSQWQTVSVKEF